MAEGEPCGLPYEHDRHPYVDEGLMKMCNGEANK